MNRTMITTSCFALFCAVGCSSSTKYEAADSPNDSALKRIVEKTEKKQAQSEPAEAGAKSELAKADEAADEAAAKPAEKPARKFTRIKKPLFAESPEKIEFKKTTWALATPFADGDRLGLVSGGKPIKTFSHVINDECETPWIEVAPRGFVCMEAEPAREPKANKKKRAKKKRKRAMIGSYAIAAKGARFFKSIKAAEEGKKSRPARGDMLRLGKSITLEDGRTFRRTDRGEYIATSDIRRLWGSKYAGVKLPATLSNPVAFAVNRRSVKGKVVARKTPSAKGRVAKRIKPRTLVNILELSEDKAFARIADNQWVDRADLREIDVQEPPAEVAKGVNNHWADVDLDKQLVVIYEGKRPVFATLASTGREEDRTPTGVFRVTRKKKRTTMRSDRSRRQTYSAAVPWSTYFHRGIAFHTAYWHDSFGKARSHGCVNLSPTDALTIYEMLGPDVPEGWSVVYGHESQLGSVVQVRSVRPNPVVEEPETETKVATN